MQTTTAVIADTIATITTTRTGGLDPLNAAHDTTRLDTLTASLAERGWVGPPVVAVGEQALTGSHRLWAADRLWYEDIEIRVPRVQVADLCELYGVDWYAVRDENADDIDAAVAVAEMLPAGVRDYLGMDI